MAIPRRFATMSPSTTSASPSASESVGAFDVSTRMIDDEPGRGSGGRLVRHLVAGILVVLVLAWIALVVRHAYNLSRGTWNSAWDTVRWLPTIATSLPRNSGVFAITGLLVIAMSGPGALVLRLFRLDWHDHLEQWVYSLCAGLACWVPVVLSIGTVVGLGREGILVSTLVYLSPCLYFAGRFLRRLGHARPRLANLPLPRRLPWVEIFLGAVLCALLYLSLLGALQPETNFDARWYHLGSASHFVEVGRFYNIVVATHDPAMGLNPYQEISLTGLFALVGVHGARLLSFFDYTIICLGIVAFARAHLGSVRIGLFAALAFASIPSASWAASTAYNDLPVALYTLLSVHALVTWCKAPHRWGWAYLGIAAAAFAFGVKAFGLFSLALAFACLVALPLLRPQLRRLVTVGRLAIAVGVAAITCLPWWIRSFSMTRNPVFPLLNGVFHSTYWNSYAAAAQADANRKVSLGTLPQGLARSVWTTVANPTPFHSLVGPFFLIGIPLAVLLAACTTRRPRGTVVFLAGYVLAWSGTWYLSAVSDSRYLLGIAPPACLAIVTVVADAIAKPRVGRLLPVAGACVLVAVGLSTTQILVPVVRGANSPAILGRIAFGWDYLFRGEPERDVQLQYLPMVEYINAHLPIRTSKVYDGDSLNGVYLYLRTELFNGSGYGSPGTMHQWQLSDPDAITKLRENGVTDVVVPVAAVDGLSTYPVWKDLRRTYTSSDGLVLFHVVPGSASG